jgi:hypothetical protein
MIVTVCGAYRNAGDHLIGERGRALVRRFVDPEVITVDRRAIGAQEYALFNRARAVLLCGGPAYQREIFPKVYPIERQKVSVPIIPFGLGWKSPVGKSPASFAFQKPALEFVRDIHAAIPVSSARDPLTVEMLGQNGVGNVAMTGCPAWYDLEHFEERFRFIPEPRQVVLSMPAIMQPGVGALLDWLGDRFPKSRRVVSYHHGIIPATTRRGISTGLANTSFAARAIGRGWRIASLAGSLPKLERLYGATDLHVGYRVHAHLFCLSRRIASILINEDSRGEGQARALGTSSLVVGGGDIGPITEQIDRHFSERGAGVEASVERMRETLPTMREFLGSI